MNNKKVLITAGATREYLDPLRFISNPASGKIGFELAKIFSRNGYKTILVSGKTFLVPPKNVKFYSVETSKEMFRIVKHYFPQVDLFISSAAVTDFKPEKIYKHKIKKKGKLKLILVPTVDILKYCGEHKKRNQLIIGFALETHNKIKNAFKKLKEKNVDYIVLNDPKTFGSEYIKPTIISKTKEIKKFPKMTKSKFAKVILNLISHG